jgi:alpha,alpha-trehalose-phosphate synthase [UDP-forming]
VRASGSPLALHPSTLSPTSQRLLVVSNRLPIVVEKKNGAWSLRPGSGGLVNAMAPVLAHRGGLWIGWPGMPLERGGAWEAVLAEGYRERGYDLVPVLLSEGEVRGFYEGFSNAILWPLFHDLLGQCKFEPSFWYAYLKVNEKFAHCVLKQAREDDFVWVQDYQMIHVAELVRRRTDDLRLGFFLHIPFPPLDILLKLPWRGQILRALLAYDLLGFQTPRDTRNFLTCLENLLPETEIVDGGPITEVHLGARTVRVGAFPIGIDFRALDESARSAEVVRRTEELRSRIGPAELIVGVDRLDYTKGLPERLESFRNALQRHRELREKVLLFQVVVPSREGVPEYQALKARIEQLVGEINGEFSVAGWVPVHYHYKTLGRRDLISLYRMARICLVTPIKDGMNLVAKEFCACQVEGRGVLVLSEFAGAAAQLHRGALLVNPHDIEGMADALKTAFDMGEDGRRRRMDVMRESGREQDIFWWVDYYLQAALGTVPHDFRTPKEYFPPLGFEEHL